MSIQLRVCPKCGQIVDKQWNDKRYIYVCDTCKKQVKPIWK